MYKIIRIAYLFTGFFLFVSNSFAQAPKLNSHPSSSATIYLDFDGQYVTGTSWNWAGAIYAQPSGLSNDVITEIFNRMSEDYRSFNLNITTDSSVYFSAPFDKRMRSVITTTSEWYGSAGGISFVGSFNWGNETPAWVFSAALSYNAKLIAEACSHEAGHTLGLQHQSIYDANCQKLSEYNGGQGEGEIGWAPIMGLGYYKNLTTWNIGPNAEGCSVIQNDFNIIANSINDFGVRDDDYGNDPVSATVIPFQGLSFMVNGLINSKTDVDAFKMNVQTSSRLSFGAIPQNVGSGNAGADLDIKIIIKDAQFNTIAVYNPDLLLSVGLDTSLNAGDYYIMVTGTGNKNNFSDGSLGFYWLVGNMTVILPVTNFDLKADAGNGNHILNWTYDSDEKIKRNILETSPDGKLFHQLASLNADAKSFSYKASENDSYYRLKVITADEKVYYSSISKIVPSINTRPVQILGNMVQHQLVCIARTVHSYQLFDTGGRLLLKGNLVKGVNNIDLASVQKGILLFRLSDGVGTWTERLIKQ